MITAICTLFERNYHHGVAALINSLHNQGFRGDVYVGYRGVLPEWAIVGSAISQFDWKGATSLRVNDNIQIHFLPVETSYHLTNYKPDFMLDLWDGPAKNADAMFYFDPDIVIKCNFSFFESWVDFGVALVHEITANDMTANNPIRGMWKKIISENEETVNHNINSYINAGFIGLNKRDIAFLEKFKKIQHLAESRYNVNLTNFDMTHRGDPFFANDQDALNIAAMCCNVPISEMGPEAMDFIHGGFTMSHAVGSPKPWNKSFVLSALKAMPPTYADKGYWDNAGFPIATCSKNFIKRKKISIKIASFIGRFYRKY